MGKRFISLTRACALGIVITIVFSMVLFRGPEWTKGIQSHFIVYGQGNTFTGGAVVTKIIPQIAVGSGDGNISKYKTVIQVVNEGTTSATVSGSFYDELGAASTLVLRTNLSTLPTVTGNFSFVTLPSDGVLVITGDTAPSLAVNWGKIVSTGGTVSVSAYFELTSGDGAQLYSRVGVPASEANLSQFTIPRVRNVDNNLDVGFALVNTGTSSARIDATLWSAAGSSLGTQTLTLGPGAHKTAFAQDFFGLKNETSGTNYSYMTFQSASPQFAATALAIQGGSLAGFPVSTPTSNAAGTTLSTGSVTTATLADAAVTTGKVADGAITGAKVASGQVVKSINNLTDNLTLTAGANVTITPSGNTIIIAAASGGTAAAANPNIITDVATPSRTALGSGALAKNTTGENNVAVGFQALTSSTTAGYNTAVGATALFSTTTGGGNTALGFGALYSDTTGDDNTAVGFGALYNNTSGPNTALGSNALRSNTTGYSNTATGAGALGNNTTGQYSTAIGDQALYSNTTGGSNTAVGWRALYSNITGFANTAIGSGADVGNGLHNATAIGYFASVNASNKIRLGNTEVTVVEGPVAYTYTSDKTKKENFQRVDAEDVLKKLQNLDVTSWNYIGNDPQQFRHYGPMAQDFFAAFGNDGVGTIGTPTTLTSGDVDGVMLLGLKALAQRTDELKSHQSSGGTIEGKVLLDSNGEAWVELPATFDNVYSDVHYQLTPIGAPGPSLYIAEEVQNGRFKIAGGQPGAKVSWRLTGAVK